MTGTLVVVVVIGALAAVGWWWLFRKSIVSANGAARIPGLGGPVEVLRDVHGVPHIFASTTADAVAALGYCHVQDRLFQMELNRRVAAGRLSEAFGKVALEADRFLRRMGLRRAAEREVQGLWDDERKALEAYAWGVNAALKDLAGQRPLELRLLGIEPDAWGPVDSLGWAKVMALNLCTNAEAEAYRAKVVAHLGAERAAELELGYAGDVVSLAPGAAASEAADELLALYRAAQPWLGPAGSGAGSNNWVISGARSASGKPMLANDPHLPLQAPNVWYEAHLVTPEVDVYGVTLPGVPGVILGHNQHVAWGMTNSNADVQDLFIEKIDGDRVQFEGQWEPLKVMREIIRVKGQPEVVEEVRSTRHGPLISGQDGKGVALSLRWAAHDPAHTVSAMLKMNGARSAEDFREALRDWHTPSQNVVFADATNIGFVMAGVVPIRNKGSGLTPVPGWTAEYEWTGWVPFEELPQAWNPPCGYVVTANNAIVDPTFKHHITWDWMNGYRAKRIEEMILAKPKLGPSDFRAIQTDVFCRPGKLLAARCAVLAPADPIEKAALRLLVDWNGLADVESAGACVYEALILAAVRRAYEPVVGPELLEELMGKSSNPLAPVGLVVGRYIGLLLRDLERKAAPPGGAPRTWDQVLSEALTDAVRELRGRIGDDPARWRWGSLHHLTLKHPLGASKALAWIFNGPEVEVGGDTDTPFQSAVVPHRPFGADSWAPSWRQIVDLQDMARTQSIHASGQSGVPGSPHYLDFFPMWQRGEYHPQWLKKLEIEAHLEGRMTLEPG